MTCGCKVEVISFEIKRRKFEGNDDPSKNNHPLTSKYMPSYRYAALYKARYTYDSGQVTERDDCRLFRCELLAIEMASFLLQRGNLLKN